MHYASKVRLLGLPLIHISTGPAPGKPGSRGIAKGWIAIGDVAFGVIFALGGLAFGGISLGGFSIGILALAGVAVGIWSVGGLAIGIFAVGGAAIAAYAAYGGLAVAGDYALGGGAMGLQANTPEARAYFEASSFFSISALAARYSRWLLLLTILLPMVHLRKKRRQG